MQIGVGWDMGDKALKATTGSIPAAEWVAIDTLAPWDKNPRRNDEAAKEVAKSIQRFGFGAPILARSADRVVIAGHTRLKAAALLKLDKVPVRFLDLDPAEARALALADNKLGELAEWDEAILGDVLREMEAEGAVLDGLGFDDQELAALLGQGRPAPEPRPVDGGAWAQTFQVLVDCGTEHEQAELLERLTEEGMTCRALTS